ncbi:restriction endonuclease [Clostridium pasteurianum]|uniref:restriction endonuclease n=1 Tax=Clostridium pasteurianum TaxID=1501 RepID=UPI0022609C61|nr:restriction endonuclease [Clostridium pasteurianum]UZW12854.1 restriction endonuclease [Clostridium pasteurianum]
MAIPTYEEVMLPLLKYISDRNLYNNKMCEEALAKEFNLSDEEVNQKLQSGKKIFYDRLNWAKTYLKNAGLIEFPKRGQFNITERGISLLKENIGYLDSKYLERYKEFNEYLGRSRKTNVVSEIEGREVTDTEEKTPFESIDESFKKIKSSLADELLEKLKEVDFFRFEDIVLDLLIKMGYGGSRVEAKKATKKTGDEGIDGIINEDRLGLDRVYIQAKRWKDTVVGRPEIQKFSGALDTPGANKGIFITTSTFSNDAIEYVNRLSNKKIILIDGQQLAEYMIDFNVGVSVETVYEIKKIDSDYFIEE